MKNKILCIGMVALTALMSTAAFAGDVGGRPIKLSSTVPVEITAYYIEERLNEVSTSTEALE